MIEIAEIWRYPIKAIGREPLEKTKLEVNKTLPWDRHWALSRKASKFDPDNPQWVRCINFLRGASFPALQAIEARFNSDDNLLTLTHPLKEACMFDPDDAKGEEELLSWLSSLIDLETTKPQKLIHLAERGLTDSEGGMISVMNLASLEDFNTKTNQNFSTKRWRGNFWMKNLPAWEERNWSEKSVQIGTAKLQIRKDIERCQMVSANPQTGERDCDAPKLLKQYFNHQNFGMSAYVIEAGIAHIGDKIEVLP